MTKNFREKEFSSKNDTKHSLFMMLVENFALFMGVILQNFALVMGTYFQNVARVMGPNSEFSKAHIYPTPYRSYPPRKVDANLNFHGQCVLLSKHQCQQRGTFVQVNYRGTCCE